MRTAMPGEESVLTLMGSVAMEHKAFDRLLPNITCDKTTLSKILCKCKQDSVVSSFLYLDSVFKNEYKLIHNQSPVMNRLCPFLLNLHN